MEGFSGLLVRTEKTDTAPLRDSCASETMFESLMSSRDRPPTSILIAISQKPSAVCSAALNALDDNLLACCKAIQYHRQTISSRNPR